MSLTLHPFQRTWADQVCKILTQHSFYLDRSPSGTGKKYVALTVAKALSLPVLVCTEDRQRWQDPVRRSAVPVTFFSINKIPSDIFVKINQGVLVIIDKPDWNSADTLRTLVQAVYTSSSRCGLLYGDHVSREECTILLYALGIISSPTITSLHSPALEEAISYSLILHRPIAEQVVLRRKIRNPDDILNLVYELYTYAIGPQISGQIGI